MEIPGNYTTLRASILRYQARLEEEEHAMSQRLKAVQHETPDSDQTIAWLGGKQSGFLQALLILRQELAGREVEP
jgi:hypothetical protein